MDTMRYEVSKEGARFYRSPYKDFFMPYKDFFSIKEMLLIRAKNVCFPNFVID